jgi:hypothetical protein
MASEQAAEFWNVGRKQVEGGAFNSASRTYYRLFACDYRGWMLIVPVVRDYNQQPFIDALQDCVDGNYATAVAKLRHILRVIPRFGEARFIIGVFEWSAGMHTSARSAWQNTISRPYFAIPSNTPPRVITEAQKLLRWSESQ